MKKQNIFNSLIFGILFFVSLASCQEEDHAGQLADDIVLRIQTQQSLSRATGLDAEAEDKIDRLDVWFYPQDAAVNEPPLLYLSVEENTEIKIDALTLAANGMSATGTYNVYVVANLPRNPATAFNEFTTPSELENCKYIADSRPGMGDESFCMSKWERLDFSSGREQSILLQRHAVKLDIKLENRSSYPNLIINKVLIRNDQRKVALFEPADYGVAPDSDTFDYDLIVSDIASTDNPAIYTAYIYENLSDIPTVIEVQATIDGVTNRTYLVDIEPGMDPDNSPKLPRNSVCMVTLRLKDPIPTDAEVIIKPWGSVSIPDISISSTYLSTNKNKVDVVIAEGGKLKVESNAETIHVDLSEAEGFYLDEHEDDRTVDVSMDTNSSELVFKYQGDVNTVIPDGKVTISAGNLRKTITLKKQVNNIQFAVHSVVINGQSITNGGSISGDYGGGTNNIKEPIIINAVANIPWGCTVEAYSAYRSPTGTPIRISNISSDATYPGSLGCFSTDKILEMAVFTGDKALLLPVTVKVTFFLDTYDLSKGGIEMNTFNFKIE